jgi:hypothetical protein
MPQLTNEWLLLPNDHRFNAGGHLNLRVEKIHDAHHP